MMTQTVLLKLAEMTRTARILILLILQTIPDPRVPARLQLWLRIQTENLRMAAEGSRSQTGLRRPQVLNQRVKQLELLLPLLVLMKQRRKARLMTNQTLMLTTAVALLLLWV